MEAHQFVDTTVHVVVDSLHELMQSIGEKYISISSEMVWRDHKKHTHSVPQLKCYRFIVNCNIGCIIVCSLKGINWL